MQKKTKWRIVLITSILLLAPMFFLSTASANDDMTPTSTDAAPSNPEVDAAAAAVLSLLTILAALKAAESEFLASGETPEKAKQHVQVLAEVLRPLTDALIKKITAIPPPPAVTKQPVPPPPSPKTKTVTCHNCSGQGWTNCKDCGGTGTIQGFPRDGHPTYNTCQCFFKAGYAGPGRLTCTVCNGTGKVTIPPAPAPVTK